jgi:RimJ/RimL family protein N-acetyltransferase
MGLIGAKHRPASAGAAGGPAAVERPTPPEARAGFQVHIRRYRAGDGPELHRLVAANAERIGPHFPGVIQGTKSAAGAARYVRDRVREWDERIAYFFAVCDSRDKRQLGQVRFKTIDWAATKAEIAYFIGGDSEGLGLMSEALHLLLGIGFDDLGLTKVFARITPANERSQKLLLRAGFLKEGLLRQDFRTLSGELADVVYYGLLSKDWRSSSAANAPITL